MPNYVVSIPAATAVVGADLLSGVVFARSPEDRTLEGIALKGSAAAGDTVVDIYIDETRVGTFANNATGFPNNDDLLPLESLFIPAGAQVRAIVTDAATTNPINLMISVEEI